LPQFPIILPFIEGVSRIRRLPVKINPFSAAKQKDEIKKNSTLKYLFICFSFFMQNRYLFYALFLFVSSVFSVYSVIPAIYRALLAAKSVIPAICRALLAAKSVILAIYRALLAVKSVIPAVLKPRALP
jgi:hypothetical protein